MYLVDDDHSINIFIPRESVNADKSTDQSPADIEGCMEVPVSKSRSDLHPPPSPGPCADSGHERVHTGALGGRGIHKDEKNGMVRPYEVGTTAGGMGNRRGS